MAKIGAAAHAAEVERVKAARKRVTDRVRDLQEVLHIPPASSPDLYTQLVDLFDALERELDSLSLDSTKLDVVATHVYNGKNWTQTAIYRELHERGKYIAGNQKVQNFLQIVS